MKRFARDARGATAIEYALLIAILGLGIITAASTLKNQIYNSLGNTTNAMASAAAGS
ncbi:Flp family type IVb pilin [Phenylobacterium sp.]|uniref:Flp family type IVb pilin n=1 Tax=Phenylobacterium sp. TaxID=1871053 RepID=UPI0035AECFCC